MATETPAHPTARRLSLPTRLFYGFGSVAFGVKDNGFSYFLAFFYAQVVGLPAQTVGFAIMLALILDAFIDPLVGQLSDNTRSKWGRRHPWMYAAAIPVALSYILIWNPPTGWSQGGQVAYLVAVAVLIRSFISCYEIPSAALAAELTTEYDERTRLLSYRYLFGWAGGLAVYGLALAVFLKPTAEFPVGQLNPQGYANYGLFAGGLMLFAILVTSIGTHRQIPFLRDPPQRRATVATLAREMVGTLHNRNFLMILASSFFLYAGIGLGFAINLYFATYYWEFGAGEIALFALSSLTAAILAFIAAPRLAKRFDKRPTAILLIPAGLAFQIGPIALRLLGAFPANDSPIIFGVIFVTNILSVGLGIVANILFSSMIADVVEDAELKTGRRQEGLFFAAIAFANKSTTGLGIFAAGLIIGAIHFPTGAKPGSVPVDVIRGLGLVYVPTQIVLYCTAALLLLGYGISRASHMDTLRKLAAAADLAQEGGPAAGRSKLS
ncbi:MAG: MFS transporter [Alphaproteobacteria bacterium]|nr:MFS transporter [Alphaproteobacteria bacterium]MBU1515228.1 MFS transporter [Alphaproteobacteria bacterium]MBU2092358.1 MFS transporter [Alphaproteobacteria bacterium]MBU2152952.1 MFS transporter [Alphaproteobacteria bacterium]MBU2305783.1 MFS transporter [Alphaproteobacteria bacterium]